MSKIGQSVKLKQKDKGPYYVLGLAATVDGYELRKLKMEGDQMVAMQTLHRGTVKAELMQRLQTEVASYIIEFNQRGDK
jgi:hypothetical protein